MAMRQNSIFILLFLSVFVSKGAIAQDDADSSIDKHASASGTGFATNMSGDTSEHAKYDDGNKKIWGHKLPIFGQAVLDKGFDLPEPYGISAIYVGMEQNVNLSDLRISFGQPINPQTPVPFVTFGDSWVDTKAYNLKLDMWLFPFLNTFIIANELKGNGLIPIEVPGADILNVLAPPLGALCDGPVINPLRPALCDADVVILDQPDYTGKTLGVGIILPIGWKNFFAALPLSYTYTDTSNSTGTIKTFTGSLRLGFHFKPKHTGQLALYIGSTYLDSEQDITGLFQIDTGTDALGEIDINYTIHQTPADKWNYLAGFNWVITKRWWAQAEAGFGGQRDDVIASINYRW